MVGPRKIKKIELTEGRFKEIVVPEIEGVDINLKTKQEVTYSVKTNEVLEAGPANYEIIIDVSKLNNGIENKELSEAIQDAANMPFSLYSMRSQTYRYFTTSRTTEAEKEGILKKILDVVTKFSKNVVIADNTFDKDLENEFTAETREIVVFPCEIHDKKVFVVALKDYLENKADFARLATISSYNGFLSTDKKAVAEIGDVSISKVKKYFPNFNKRNKFFVVNPKFHNALKDFVQEKQLKEGYFNEEQKKKSNVIDVHSVEITKPNVFGISIKFDEEKGVFLFTGKSYFQKPILIRNTWVLNRSIWGEIAENAIYSKATATVGNDSNSDYSYTENNAERLQPLKGGSSKTGWEIPVSEFPKLQKIKKEFDEQQKIFGREELAIDIYASVDVSCAWSKESLAILYDDKNCYVVYGYRQALKKAPDGINEDNYYVIKKPKVVKDGDLKFEDENQMEKYYVNKITFYGFKITAAEAEMFLAGKEEYETVGSSILKNSKNLNALLSVKNSEFKKLTFEEMDEILQVKKLHYQMHEEKELREKEMPKIEKPLRAKKF